jgi:phage shock protein PspC (stress-responsive transcriptional regulator)
MNLIRPRRGRVIAGVCAAVANRFGVPGPQILAYIILWILIPNEY